MHGTKTCFYESGEVEGVIEYVEGKAHGLRNGFTKMVRSRLGPNMSMIRNTGLVKSFTKVVRLSVESNMLKVRHTDLGKSFMKMVI